MNNSKSISGFTLIELIVVLSLITVLLLFSFPVLKSVNLFSNSNNQIGDITRLINDLKKRALVQQLDFILHIDTIAGTIWVTDDTMDEEAIELSKEKGIPLSEEISVLDIEFPGIKESENSEYQIRFRKQGYSDFALIHLIKDGNNITLKIEPFLSKTQLADDHIYIEDCI